MQAFLRQGSWAWLTLAWSCGCTAAPADEPFSLQGTWLVEKVAVDLNDQPHWHYFPDDPRLLGRVLQIGSGGQLEFNFGNNGCDAPQWSTRPAASLSALVGTTFPRPQPQGAPARPTLQDFGLAPLQQTVTPHVATCLDGPRRSPWGATPWFAPLAAARLAVAYGADTLLVLRKLAPQQSVAPSFACKGMLNPAEKSLCSSPALAGYDRSVAAAYQRSLARQPDERARLEKAQREWLASRNACRDDAVCLEEKMAERIEALMQE